MSISHAAGLLYCETLELSHLSQNIHTCSFLGVLRRKALPPRYRAVYPVGLFSPVFGISVDNGHWAAAWAAAGPLDLAPYLAGRPCVCYLQWLCDPRL